MRHRRSSVTAKRLKRPLQCTADPSMTWPWSEHEPASPKPARSPTILFVLWRHIFMWKIMTFCAPAKCIHIQNHRIVRLPRKVTSQDYQVVCMFPVSLSISFYSLFRTLLFFFPSLFSTKFVNVFIICLYFSFFFFVFVSLYYSSLFSCFIVLFCTFVFLFLYLFFPLLFFIVLSFLFVFLDFSFCSFLLFFPKLGKRDQTSFDNTDCVDPNLAPWK